MGTDTMNETTIQTTPASRREGTVMGIKNNRKRLAAAAIVIAGLAGGAVAAHAATFGSRYLAAGIDGPPTYPSITPTCLADCAIALDAGTGTVAVADAVNGPQNVPIYGFNVNGADGGAHTLAGGNTSTIKVPVGTTLTITLTQAGVGAAIDLSFPSLPASDVSHAGNVYTVKASKIGTSVFQPGAPDKDAPKQVAMGLVGVLIVTPDAATCTSATLSCAYNGTAYNDEALIATTDLDAQFAAGPWAFDMGYFGQSVTVDGAARKVYHVVNGKSFPDTDVIDVKAGDSLLLRSVNAGVNDKSMSLLGLRQTLLARNSSAYADPQTFIAPLVGPGETADLTIQIPTTATQNQRYALIDAGRQMNHGNGYGFGGALTFLNVWS
jgi:FtsP/CotA-like multicopper oxidase with cupredoxin domain